MRVYYAQNKEDILIKSFFPDIEKGFYFDIGANDPIHDSVTKIFYDQGWSGVNVEPIHKLYLDLKRNRPRDINLNIGLGSTGGSFEFTEYPKGNGLSTFDPKMQEFYKNEDHSFPVKGAKKYLVEVQTLATVIKTNKIDHIHFMKVDVEGFELDVIKGYDWKRVRPELICIEANHISKDQDWRPLLEKSNYSLIFFDGINNYYLAKESIHRAKFFDYPTAVFSGNPVYAPAIQEIEFPLLEKIQHLTQRLKEQENQTQYLYRQQRDIRFLAKRIFAEARVRISRRAMSNGSTEHLYYKSDKRVQGLIDGNYNPSEIVDKVHDIDGENIAIKRSKIKEKLMPLLWSIIDKSLSLTIKVGKKVLRHAK